MFRIGVFLVFMTYGSLVAAGFGACLAMASGVAGFCASEVVASAKQTAIHRIALKVIPFA
jgi:hypothetical protein